MDKLNSIFYDPAGTGKTRESKVGNADKNITNRRNRTRL
jgi:hypothetical protein